MSPRKLALSVVVLVLAAAAVAVVLLRSSGPSETALQHRLALSTSRLNTIAAEIHSASSSRATAVVALPPGRTLPLPVVRQLHDIGRVRFKTHTLRQIDANTATVQALVTRTGAASRLWTVTLSRVRGRWLVASTAAPSR